MVSSCFVEIQPLTRPLRLMISALHQRKLLPTLVMLFALAGLSLSVIGESFSHGVANLAGDWESQPDGHPGSYGAHGHTHDFDEEPEHPQCIMMLAIILTRPWTSSGFRLFQSLTVLRQPVPLPEVLPAVCAIGLNALQKPLFPLDSCRLRGPRKQIQLESLCCQACLAVAVVCPQRAQAVVCSGHF